MAQVTGTITGPRKLRHIWAARATHGCAPRGVALSGCCGALARVLTSLQGWLFLAAAVLWVPVMVTDERWLFLAAEVLLALTVNT